MAVTISTSFTLTIRDLANLANLAEATITGAGNVTVSTVYDSAGVVSGGGAATDTIRLVAFGGTKSGVTYPGVFAGLFPKAVTLTTGAAVAATNDVTLTLVTPQRYHQNAVQLLDVLRRQVVSNNTPFLPTGSSPGNQVTYTA